MGFPIPYAGVLPRLLFTAAISLASIRDFCISLLHSLGLISIFPPYNSTPNHDINHTFHQYSASDYNNYPSQTYFNPHLHSPSDLPLLLRRTSFFDAVQASLPVLLYENLPLDRVTRQCSDAMQSSPPSSSQSHTGPTARTQAIILQDSVLVNSMSSSSSSLMSSLFLSSQSTASHVSGIYPKLEDVVCTSTVPQSEQHMENQLIDDYEAFSSNPAATPPILVLAPEAYNLQIQPQKRAMATRSNAAYIATPQAYESPDDQLQEHPHPLLSLPCSHDDHYSQHSTLASKLQQQLPATRRSPISACGQEGTAASSSYASNYRLQLHAECAVCLCEFKRGEEVRELPLCSHIFHKDCIDGWLLHNHRTCPLCRSSLLTPAAEMQERMQEQELTDQVTSWLNSLQQEEGALYQDHYLQHVYNTDHYQDFNHSLQPAGN